MLAKLHPSWLPALQNEFQKPYILGLNQFLAQENKQGKSVYPKPSGVFNAFNLTPFNEVKVVILGQDPYHGAKQAHGLSFSVQKGVAVPPSLRNIYKELQTDIPGFNMPSHGNLSSWAKQGVLLLNATLTVRENEPGSHQKMGWEQFTDQAIRALSEQREGLVFMLWGRHAQAKASLIDTKKHLVLMAAHPSSFSAYAGFFGCKHFSKANAYLLSKSEKPIDWQLV
jgi:uracil-DNA glycosylase